MAGGPRTRKRSVKGALLDTTTRKGGAKTAVPSTRRTAKGPANKASPTLKTRASAKASPPIPKTPDNPKALSSGSTNAKAKAPAPKTPTTKKARVTRAPSTPVASYLEDDDMIEEAEDEVEALDSDGLDDDDEDEVVDEEDESDEDEEDEDVEDDEEEDDEEEEDDLDTEDNYDTNLVEEASTGQVLNARGDGDHEALHQDDDIEADTMTAEDITLDTPHDHHKTRPPLEMKFIYHRAFKALGNIAEGQIIGWRLVFVNVTVEMKDHMPFSKELKLTARPGYADPPEWERIPKIMRDERGLHVEWANPGPKFTEAKATMDKGYVMVSSWPGMSLACLEHARHMGALMAKAAGCDLKDHTLGHTDFPKARFIRAPTGQYCLTTIKSFLGMTRLIFTGGRLNKAGSKSDPSKTTWIIVYATKDAAANVEQAMRALKIEVVGDFPSSA